MRPTCAAVPPRWRRIEESSQVIMAAEQPDFRGKRDSSGRLLGLELGMRESSGSDVALLFVQAYGLAESDC